MQLMEGGDVMFLADFCKNIYDSCPQITTREDFIEALFVASGSPSYISVSYKRLLFKGDKEFIEKKKAELRNHDNKESLTSFFNENIEDDKVGDVIAAFGIPEKAEVNKRALCISLAVQMKAIIDSDENGADDMVAMVYQEEKINRMSECGEQENYKPIYRGDSAFVSSETRHEIGVYDSIEHTWEIHNTGKVQWTNRKLVYMRGTKDRPEANPPEIKIPNVLPNKSTKITTTFDGRGFEEITCCKWEMQDEDGDNCFPNQESKFSVTIDAKFKRD